MIAAGALIFVAAATLLVLATVPDTTTGPDLVGYLLIAPTIAVGVLALID